MPVKKRKTQKVAKKKAIPKKKATSKKIPRRARDDKRKKKLILHLAQHELDQIISPKTEHLAIKKRILEELGIIDQPTTGKFIKIKISEKDISPHILNLRKEKAKKEAVAKKKKEIDVFIQHVAPHTRTSSRAGRRPAKTHKKQFTPSWSFGVMRIYRIAPKAFTVLLVVAAIIAGPYYGSAYYYNLKEKQTELESLSQQTFEQFQTAADSLLNQESEKAASTFLSAGNNLLTIDKELSELNFLVSSLSNLIKKDQSISSAKKLITAGENLSLIGIQLSRTLKAFHDNQTQTSLIDKIKFIHQKTKFVLPLLQETEDLLNKTSLQIAGANLLTQKLNSTKQLLQTFNQTAPELISALGEKTKKRYLIVFQNNSELRATGGFIGSFAIVEIDQGKISNIEIPEGGSYDLKGELTTNYIAPRPMQLINARWEFQDANWFADYPTSANKLAEFLERCDGPTVNGVIAINAAWAADLVDLIGPLAVENKLFTGKNFIHELEMATLPDPTEGATPKKIISQLTQQILQTIPDLEQEKLLPLINLAKDGLNKKQILLYSTNEKLQKAINFYNWDDHIMDFPFDYLKVVNTNIGGGKSDLAIEQNVDVQVAITETGEIINTVTISRTHHGDSENPFSAQNNVDYLRVYVPQGSKLISAFGDFEIPEAKLFETPAPNWKVDQTLYDLESKTYIEPKTGTEIHDEFNKTVFANWLQTKPGEITKATFRYKLPFKLKFQTQESLGFFARQFKKSSADYNAYSLLLQKQPGQQNNSVNVQIKIAAGLNVRALPSNILDKTYSSEFEQDEMVEVIFLAK